MTYLKKSVTELEEAIFRHAWEHCAEICFYVLYWIPELSIRKLVVTMLGDYLPNFHSRWKNETWPEQILNQTGEWYNKSGRAIPQHPEVLNPADAAFVFGLDALLLGFMYKSDPVIRTSSYVAAINAAINAHAIDAWIADDPEAVTLWESQGYFPGRSVTENTAAIEMTVRKWQMVVDWLKNKRHVKFFEPGNQDEVKRALKQWKDHEMSLIIPKTEKEKRDGA